MHLNKNIDFKEEFREVTDVFYFITNEGDINNIYKNGKTLEFEEAACSKGTTITVTNLKISVEFKELSEDEIKTIVENDKVVENIDKVIEHLITANHSWVSWMR